ncbi:MAG: hypothetical protein H0Z33_09535 [Bacillaceae bacterium]|nr:hypothetical protein [Bacillaceae bacterium]
MESLRQGKPFIILIIGILLIAIFLNLDQSHLFSPVTEIEIVKRNGNLLQEEIIRIRDRDWIKKIMQEIEEASFIKEQFPPDRQMLEGDSYYIRVNRAEFTEMAIDIYSGRKGGFSDNAVMVISDRKHYTVPPGIKNLLRMELNEYHQASDEVEIWLDDWKQLVMIEGQPFFAHKAGVDLDKKVFLKKAFTIEKRLTEPVSYRNQQDIDVLLADRTGTFPEGTTVYRADGYYFIKGGKKSDIWLVLLPYGQATHDIDRQNTDEVQYGESRDTAYFVVRDEAGGYRILSAEDPGALKGCQLQWQSDAGRFVSPCTSLRYFKSGEPETPGFTPMKEFPSFVWHDVIFYRY